MALATGLTELRVKRSRRLAPNRSEAEFKINNQLIQKPLFSRAHKMIRRNRPAPEFFTCQREIRFAGYSDLIICVDVGYTVDCDGRVSLSNESKLQGVRYEAWETFDLPITNTANHHHWVEVGLAELEASGVCEQLELQHRESLLHERAERRWQDLRGK